MKKLEWMERGRGGYEARVGAVWLTVAYVDRARGIQPTMGFRLADAVDWKPPGDDDFDTCKPKAIALARSRIAGAVAELRDEFGNTGSLEAPIAVADIPSASGSTAIEALIAFETGG